MEGWERSGGSVGQLRRWLLWVLALGLAGVEAELLLLEHYEDAWQWAPLVLIGLALAAVGWQMLRPGAASLRALRILMVLFLLAGLAGVGLHFRGAAGFQLEIDPGMGTWDLVKRVMHAKAPPVLAPGVMLQLGLIGLAYGFSNSEGKRSERP
jgi:hypothetical protein